ncbi:putative hexokinase [Apiospora rasikravindrae]|uniref:Phosphotransferase n=1 Tax=Apiospora rasikravindrae TaxID=990691 RepID=A0ABR1U1T4_9PEZI
MEPDFKDYLRPLDFNAETAHQLARELCCTFKQLAAESAVQFLATPVSESILRPPQGSEKGRGGTNLRVGFVELLGKEDSTYEPKPGLQNGNGPPTRLRRHLEKSWPIFDHLKNEHPDELFSWIGKCIAEVVADGCQSFGLPQDVTLPLGVTFSFPMVQHTLSQAELMSMGKGFAITSKADLGSHLLKGYETWRAPGRGLPPIRIAAIANDAVSTLVSFVYQSQESQSRKAAMGLICGTGSNATIPLRQSMLHPSKLPKVEVLNGHNPDEQRIAVNTEWSINGTAPALRALGLISKWDEQLDAAGEVPGFQPLEYMTAGRYLGELGRLILLDYLKSHRGFAEEVLPTKLQQRFGLTTTFLSHFKPPHPSALLEKLEAEFPVTDTNSGFAWTEDMAIKIYKIAKSIEIRAAGIVAAATVGLMACAGDIPLRESLGHENTEPHHSGTNGTSAAPTDLVVGYTGGCIAHFQDYLVDCQGFLGEILRKEFGPEPPFRVTLSPCHDGGITGAGVLCGAAQAQYELAKA